MFAGLPLLLMAPQTTPPPTNKPTATTTTPAKPIPIIRSIDLIEPGTVIDRTPPRGWSHLVLKSQPSLPDDQRRQVSEMTARLATLVFTTTLVNVQSHGTGKDKRYRLARIGLGMGVKINGKDVVVSPDTHARLGANLGLLARQVVSGVYEKQKTCRLVAVGPTLAIMDTPAFMPRGRGHAAAIMRYVFLVDAETGKLETLVWRIDTDSRGGYEGTVGLIEWLPDRKMINAKLQVDLSEFRLGIPSEKAFAVTSIPSGQRQFSIPDGLRPIAGTARLSGEQAGRLTRDLREMVRAASSAASR
jgi:hypothetical protein